MQDDGERLRGFKFSWRASVKDAEAFVYLLESQFPGALSKISEAMTRRGRRILNKMGCAAIICLPIAIYLASGESHAPPEWRAPTFIFQTATAFAMMMFPLTMLFVIWPDRRYRKELADIKNNLPRDIVKKVEQLLRRFEIDTSRRPYVISYRRTVIGGEGGAAAGGET